MTFSASILASVIAISAFGCASVTSGQRPQTLGKGGYQVGLETSYRATLERDSVLAFPMFGVAARYGVSDRFDAGARVSSAGVGLQGKWLVRDGERSVWSLAPTIDWVHSVRNGIVFDAVESALPLLVSYEVSPRFQLIASPRIHSSAVSLRWGERSSLHTLGVGSGVGVAIAAWRGWLVPEVGVLWPFLITGHPADEMGGTTTHSGRVIAQLSLSFLLEAR